MIALADSSGNSVWLDLLEVVIVGSIAGVVLSTAFALLVRGVVNAGAARRDGRSGPWAGNAALATAAGAVCVAAVVFAVYEMVKG